MATFKVSVPADGQRNLSFQTFTIPVTSPVTIIKPRGTALGSDPSSLENGLLACDTTGTTYTAIVPFAGFLTRDVTADGSATTLAGGAGNVLVDGLLGVERGDVLPFKSGLAVSVEAAEEIEAGGSDYLWTADSDATGITGGTHDILSSSTAVGIYVNLYGGKWRVAQTGEPRRFVVAGLVTAADGDGDFVLRLRRTGI